MTPNRIAALGAALASVAAAIIPLLTDISVQATVVLCVAIGAVAVLAWKYLHGSQQWDALIGAQKEGAHFKREFERQLAEEDNDARAVKSEAIAQRKAAMIQEPAGPLRQPGPPKPKRR